MLKQPTRALLNYHQLRTTQLRYLRNLRICPPPTHHDSMRIDLRPYATTIEHWWNGSIVEGDHADLLIVQIPYGMHAEDFDDLRQTPARFHSKKDPAYGRFLNALEIISEFAEILLFLQVGQLIVSRKLHESLLIYTLADGALATVLEVFDPMGNNKNSNAVAKQG